MKIAIHQPGYWPWLGLLDKIAKVDRFIVLDNVDWNKESYQHRNIFLCRDKSKYLTLPVDGTQSKKKINELVFQNQFWHKDHLNKLREYYSKAPYFDELYPLLEKFYTDHSQDLPVELMIATMRFACDYLDIPTPFVCSSYLMPQGQKASLVLDICKKSQAREYLCGQGAFAYMQPELPQFDAENIGIQWHTFSYPRYTQWNRAFIDGLSCLDLFFFQGQQQARELFWSNTL